jgi:hypothetical protein
MTTRKGGRPAAGSIVLRPGDEGTERWTFTTERWTDRSKLLADGALVVIQEAWAIEKGRGYFRDLLQAIEGDGYAVKVETPLREMVPILKHYGFVEEMHWQDDNAIQPVVSRWRRAAT